MKELVWEITESCLNSCLHCSSCLTSEDALPKVVSPYYADLVGRGFRAAGFERLILSGGEPALHPQFGTIVEVFHRLGFEILMYTSGVYPAGFLKAEEPALAKISKVLISFFSHREAVHDAIVGNPGAFLATVGSIKQFIKAGISVEANIVPMKHNQHDLKATSDFLVTLGVERVNILKLVRQGNAEKNWSLVGPDNSVLSETIESLQDDSAVRVGNPFGKQKSNGQFCGAGYQKVCISFDGYVIPCEVFKNDRMKFPNIFKTDFCLNSTLEKFKSLHDLVTATKSGCYSHEIRRHLGIIEDAA